MLKLKKRRVVVFPDEVFTTEEECCENNLYTKYLKWFQYSIFVVSTLQDWSPDAVHKHCYLLIKIWNCMTSTMWQSFPVVLNMVSNIDIFQCIVSKLEIPLL